MAWERSLEEGVVSACLRGCWFDKASTWGIGSGNEGGEGESEGFRASAVHAYTHTRAFSLV